MRHALALALTALALWSLHRAARAHAPEPMTERDAIAEAERLLNAQREAGYDDTGLEGLSLRERIQIMADRKRGNDARFQDKIARLSA